MISDVATTLFDRLRHGAGIGIGLLALVLVLGGCDAVTDEDLGDSNPQTPSITEIVTEVRALSTLEQAVTDAELVDDLQGDGLTLFAPVNSAFENIDTSTLLASSNSPLLREVLTYHVVPQRITTSDISDGMTVQTLEGEELTFQVDGNDVTVNGVTISNPDVDASNGVVHVTEGVLLETVDAVDRAGLTPQFSILRRLLEREGLTGALRGPGPDDSEGLTVFAPTDEAMLSVLDADGNGQVDDDEVPSNADDILRYHVLDSEFFAEDVPTTATDVPTLEGSDVTVQRFSRSSAPDSVTVNGNGVILPDVRVENGVIHGIDTVLTP